PRLDFINTQPLSRKAESELLARLCAAVPGFDVVIVSDQAETSAGGVVTPAMRRALEKLADAHPEKVFWGDSRARPELFRKVIVKPNQQEAEAACARLFGHTDYRRLFDHIQAKRLLVTHGPKGVLLVNDSRETWVTTQPVANPVDICGAGDSFSAGAAAALAVGAPAETAARFGNQVASVTIMKRGTGTASPEELLQAKLWHSWNSTRAS
ncbi:MAG: ribokinase, partial [Bryobacteraceae bacterium]|nr:ribokinase [Bryobacteraceae bacterium]